MIDKGDLTGWEVPEPLSTAPMVGRFVRVEPLVPGHSDALFSVLHGHDANWRFLPYGPFDRDGLNAWVDWASTQQDTLFFALCDPKSGIARGVASYLRIEPVHGYAEVGHINFAPKLKGTPAASEAMFLMMARVFDSGYRRYEWKCDASNFASRRAAQRLGFSYEGIFRQHRVVKGRNRDTAWLAVLDEDWATLSEAFEIWLRFENFNPDGSQRSSLSNLTRPLLRESDPALARS